MMVGEVIVAVGRVVEGLAHEACRGFPLVTIKITKRYSCKRNVILRCWYTYSFHQRLPLQNGVRTHRAAVAGDHHGGVRHRFSRRQPVGALVPVVERAVDLDTGEVIVQGLGAVVRMKDDL